jgi:signal peptidase II
VKRFGVVIAVALSVVVCDQVTKYLAVRDLTDLFARAGAQGLGERLALFFGEREIEHLRHPPVRVLPGWRHGYTENPGAAFGLMREGEAGFRVAFFTVVTVLASAFVLVMAHRVEPGRYGIQAALGGILGGVLGNYVCRISRGYVIDFVDWYVGDPPRVHVPTFNIADVGITLGVVVLLTLTLKETFRRDA